MSIEFRHLRHFVAVAEELHFARAAARVGIEQSPLSRSIRELEARLGVRLFLRTTRSTRLTPPGEILLQDARRVLASVNELRRATRVAASGKTGRARIGVHRMVSPTRLTELLSRCRSDLPALEIQLVELDEAAHSAANTEVDLCITSANLPDDWVTSVIAWTETLIALLPPKHTLTEQKRIPLPALEPDRVHAHSESTICALVAAGYGTGVVRSSFAVPPDLHVVSRPISGRGGTLEFVAATRRNQVNPAVPLILGCLQSVPAIAKIKCTSQLLIHRLSAADRPNDRAVGSESPP